MQQIGYSRRTHAHFVHLLASFDAQQSAQQAERAERRAAAHELKRQGWKVDAIADQLDVSASHIRILLKEPC